jgi:hypothetical protein
MSQDLPGVALYPDDLSVVRCSLSAFRRRRLSRGPADGQTGSRTTGHTSAHGQPTRR